MRSSLHLVLATALGTAGIASPAAAAPDPNALYEEGRKDYAEGRYESAVSKLEQAYKTGKDPLMLYTIAQAYRDWGKSTSDLARLRKAKETLEKFVVALQTDPTLGDPAEIEPEIADLDEKIKELEAAQEPEPEPEPAPEPAPPPKDPGKPLKITGLVLLGVGGATFLAGAGIGTAFGLKGMQASEDIKALNQEYIDLGCKGTPTSGQCIDKEDEIDAVRTRGNDANRMTLIGWAALGGGGAVLAVVGGVLFAKGRKTSSAWQAEQGARIQVLPTWGGLTVSGRF